jgi:orotidine-5'-phosphate decarboxylase
MACDLILVLDEPSPRVVQPLLRALSGEIRWVKIGLQMFTACGPDCVREIADQGFKVFLDLKLHDIPNTVGHAVESAARLPIHMLTLHTCGGAEMMRRAVAAQQATRPDLLLLGVTVLTSMGTADLNAVGVPGAPEDQVLRLARLATGALVEIHRPYAHGRYDAWRRRLPGDDGWTSCKAPSSEAVVDATYKAIPDLGINGASVRRDANGDLSAPPFTI